MRLFAAVWPPDDVLDHLDLALASVRGRPGGADDVVRWSARETWHLTAAFYGRMPDAVLGGLEADLAAVAAAAEPFELRLKGAGVFSHRVLWVGAGGDVAAMAALAEASREVGERHGAAPDVRPRHRAHLTVGRSRPGAGPARRGGPSVGRAGRRGPGRDGDGARGSTEALVQALSVYDGPPWLVDTLALVESRPGEGRGGGPLYTTVAAYPLGG